MRVVAGKIRGKKLYSLDGDNTRPTTDRVKENIFNMIAPYIYESCVLDLFAGSGALGIEALSRGAKHCDFVENNRRALDIVKKNLVDTPFLNESNVHFTDYSAFLENTKEVYDIIFLDPPYKAGYYGKALEIIKRRHLLTDGGVIVLERESGNREEVSGFEIFKNRKYGHTSVLLIKGE